MRHVLNVIDDVLSSQREAEHHYGSGITCGSSKNRIEEIEEKESKRKIIGND